ncbi:MAG: hypothetical protein WBZ11_16185, partial [Candidatus Sulfotelmatobacter sp.]
MSKSSASTKRNYAGFAAFVFIFAVAIVSAALLVISPARRGSVKGSPVFQAATKQARPNVQVSFATLPLAFEQNQGQTDAQVKYMARARGYQLFLTNNDALFSLHSKSFQPGVAARRSPLTTKLNSKGSRNQDVDSFSTVRMELVNGSSSAAVIASEPLPGKSNYYIGNDPKNWHTGVSQYARVAYKNVYPGVDLAYYGEQNKLEFDFIVAPNSSPSSIGFAFSGAQRLATSPSGDLVVSSAAGDIVLHNPVAYQKQGGIRQPVDAQFVLAAHHQVRFQLGPYDRSRELIIDPSVTYATYLGGSAEDDAYAIGFDAN